LKVCRAKAQQTFFMFLPLPFCQHSIALQYKLSTFVSRTTNKSRI
jgi:hypothetical protein